MTNWIKQLLCKHVMPTHPSYKKCVKCHKVENDRMFMKRIKADMKETRKLMGFE